MFSSFKNTELFRYFVRVDLNNATNKILKQNRSSSSLIAGSIFSGSFSILGTYLSMNESQCNKICSFFIITILFITFFIVGLLLFKFGAFIVKFLINAIKKETLPSKQEIKEYIDSFDHIACDNILISQNFIEEYKNGNISDELKEFYFYEIIYYTKVSVSIIQKLIINKDKCINDKNNINRIHLFRLINILVMLKEICDFLNVNKDNIKIDKLLKPSLFQEINYLNDRLDYFNKECEKIKKEKYSNN